MAAIKSIKVGEITYDLKATYDGAGSVIDTTYAKTNAIPTKTSQLQNDSGYLTEHQDISQLATKGELDSKVDKVPGKDLSEANYTEAEKEKLGTIASNANNYVHPIDSGNKHIPSGGQEGDILVFSEDGTADWSDFGTKIEDRLDGLADFVEAGFEAMDKAIRDLNDNLDLFSYGVEWDTTVSAPELTRIGNPLFHKSLPIQSEFKGVLANGSKIFKYLNPDDWRYKVGDDLGETRGVTFVGTNTFVAQNPSEYCVGQWIKLRTGNSEGVVTSIVDSTVTINWTSAEIPEENSTHQLILGELLDGTRGTVRVHTPKFYGKSGENGNKRWVRISTVPIDNSWVEIPEMLIDAYRSTVDTTTATPKAVSVVNTTAQFRGGGNRTAYDTYLETDAFQSDLGKPRTNISRANMRTYAANAGSEMLCYEYYKWIFYWAWVIEYATFNSQATYNAELTADGYHQGGLGSGLTTFGSSDWSAYNGQYPITPCGYCNEIGNFTGIKSKTIGAMTLSIPRWRGFDNPFGDIWTNLDGVVIVRAAANEISTVYTTTNVSEFTDVVGEKTVAGYEVASDGYIKAFDLGETAEIIPSAVGGSITTYICDYHYCNASSTALRTLLVGGHAGNGGLAGLGSFDSRYGVGSAPSFVGFRTLNRVS